MQSQTGYLELFRDNANFRNLFAARLVSNFGDWFNLLAILAMLSLVGGFLNVPEGLGGHGHMNAYLAFLKTPHPSFSMEIGLTIGLTALLFVMFMIAKVEKR